MDVGCSVGHAQGCVPSMRPRVIELRLLGYCAKRPHGEGPRLEVTTGDNELGVAGALRCVLQDNVSGRRPVRLVQQRVAVVEGDSEKPGGVFGELPAHAQTVPKPCRGHLVDCLCRIPRDPCGLLVVRVLQEVEYDFGVHDVDPRPVGAVLRGEGGGHPFLSGTVPGMATAHVRARSAATCLQGPPPEASEDVWPQASGTQGDLVRLSCPALRAVECHLTSGWLGATSLQSVPTCHLDGALDDRGIRS